MDNSFCKKYIEDARAYEEWSWNTFGVIPLGRCQKFLRSKSKTGEGKTECMDILERSYLISQLLNKEVKGTKEMKMFEKAVKEIERSGKFSIDRTDEKLLNVLSIRTPTDVKKLAVDALKSGPMRILVPGTGASLERAPLKATDNLQFFYKSIRRDMSMNELNSLKSLLRRDFMKMEETNPFLMKILAVLNMDHSNSHILMEDAKRGLGSSVISEKCDVVRYGFFFFSFGNSQYSQNNHIHRTYDVKGLPHRRGKTSKTPFHERIIPKTGVDGDFYEEEQDKVFQKMTGEQCT